MVIYSKERVSSLNVLTYYVYVVESSILIIFCLALGLAILSNVRLRTQKEYVIFAGSAIFDAFFGTAYLGAGIWRLLIYYTETYVPLYTPWACFTTPHIIIFVIVIPTSGVLTLTITLDRLFSVTFPVKYAQLTNTYSHWFFLLTFLTTIPTFCLVAVDTYTNLRDKSTSSKVCTSSLSMSAKMFDMLRGLRITCTLLSVLLYVPIALKMYSLIKRFKISHVGKMSVRQQQRTRNMTYTISLITLNELICFTVPDLILVIQGYENMIFYIMNLNKGIVNIFIFLLTQRELFKELRSSLPFFTKEKKLQKIKIHEVTLKYWKKTEIIASFQTKARISHNTVS